MELGPLQKDILTLIGRSDRTLVVNQIATAFKKTPATIFKSVELLKSKNFVFFERQEHGIRKYVKLTDLGAFAIIALNELPFSTVFKNHEYLKMPDVLQKYSLCFSSDTLRENHVSNLAGLIIRDYRFFDSTGKYIQEASFEAKHLIAAVMLEAVNRLLADKPKIDEIHYQSLTKFLEDIDQHFSQAMLSTMESLDLYDLSGVGKSQGQRTSLIPLTVIHGDRMAATLDLLKESAKVGGISRKDIINYFSKESKNPTHTADKTIEFMLEMDFINTFENQFIYHATRKGLHFLKAAASSSKQLQETNSTRSLSTTPRVSSDS